jgi:hypothetical protein
MSLLGALLGSLIALASGNRLGRRTELLMAAVLYGARYLARNVACCELWHWLAAGTAPLQWVETALRACPALLAGVGCGCLLACLLCMLGAVLILQHGNCHNCSDAWHKACMFLMHDWQQITTSEPPIYAHLHFPAVLQVWALAAWACLAAWGRCWRAGCCTGWALGLPCTLRPPTSLRPARLQ